MASTRKWTDDDRCKLCQESKGTLLHRHSCPTTLPHGGWQQPPPEARQIVSGLDVSREELLITRGLMIVRIRVPKPPQDATIVWYRTPPDILPEDARWYIDGSMFDGPLFYARRTGFGIVIISSGGLG